MKIEQLLSSYPRTRPPLTARHASVYEDQYRVNREGTRPVESLAQRLELWMHRQVSRLTQEPILELGAGTLNHVGHERANAVYDVVEPFHGLYQGRPQAVAIRSFYDSVAEIPSERKYGRIISIAVLEHMENLPREIALAASHLRSGGTFQAGIPSEGGLLWWIGWRFSTGISYYLRTKLDYGVLMRHEHLNTAPEIIAIVRYLFASVRIRRFPLPLHHLSFYTYLEARAPIAANCEYVLRTMVRS